MRVSRIATQDRVSGEQEAIGSALIYLTQVCHEWHKGLTCKKRALASWNQRTYGIVVSCPTEQQSLIQESLVPERGVFLRRPPPITL